MRHRMKSVISRPQYAARQPWMQEGWFYISAHFPSARPLKQVRVEVCIISGYILH